MGNPVITRLGRNQLWYRKWYEDKNYKNLLKTTKTFEDLVLLYLQYGFYFTGNMYLNNYWYKEKLFKKPQSIKKHFSIYFRRYFYTHSTLTIEHTYLLRKSTPEYFPLRLYILSYKNWLILSIQWFKPTKVNSKKKINNNLRVNNQLIYKNNSITNKQHSLLNRTKLIILYLKYSFRSMQKIQYKF